MSRDVTIDRLILELPGVDAAAARTIALGIAEGLAGSGIDGEHATLSTTVNATSAEPRRLAAEVVETLLERIG